MLDLVSMTSYEHDSLNKFVGWNLFSSELRLVVLKLLWLAYSSPSYFLDFYVQRGVIGYHYCDIFYKKIKLLIICTYLGICRPCIIEKNAQSQFKDAIRFYSKSNERTSLEKISGFSMINDLSFKF